MSNPRGQARLEANRRYRKAHQRGEYHESEEQIKKKAERRQEIMAINPCYLKEAKALLAGKDTRGRNKCVKLEGDD